MATLVYAASMSLDGFIAGPRGELSWLADYVEPDPLMDGFMNDVRALLVGGRTHRGDDPNAGDPEHEGAFGGQWHGPQFVVTSRPPREPEPDTTFFRDLPRAIAAAREAAGEGYVNVLGAELARSCLELGALDEVLTNVLPIMLGEGTRLFERVGGGSVALERIRSAELAHSNDLWFRVL